MAAAIPLCLLVCVCVCVWSWPKNGRKYIVLLLDVSFSHIGMCSCYKKHLFACYVSIYVWQFYKAKHTGVRNVLYNVLPR